MDTSLPYHGAAEKALEYLHVAECLAPAGYKLVCAVHVYGLQVEDHEARETRVRLGCLHAVALDLDREIVGCHPPPPPLLRGSSTRTEAHLAPPGSGERSRPRMAR